MNTRLIKLAHWALSRDAFYPSDSRSARGHLHGIKGSVYTAFDGDDFYFTDLFSKHAFSHGRIAINPEACLGYKQAVDVLHTKWRVLAADVALLRKVDCLWVYTTQDHLRPQWSEFAEGVLVEVLYWLSLEGGGGRPLFFVDLEALTTSGKSDPKEVTVTAAELTTRLRSSHPEVISLVNRLREPNAVPPVVAAAYHIADSKNAHWLREWMLTQSWAPLIPTLAFASGSTRGLSDLASAWLFSIQVADMVLWLDPLEPWRESRFVQLLREETSREHDLRGDWTVVGAPKAVKGEAWPITEVERSQLANKVERISRKARK